jgi:membrane fusion protein
VWLRVDAFPYARYGQLRAHVREVARSAVPRQDLGDAAAAGTAPRPDVFRVRVTLDADAPTDRSLAWRASLQAGMHVQASLVAERRTLVQWALEPLAALRVAGQ